MKNNPTSLAMSSGHQPIRRSWRPSLNGWGTLIIGVAVAITAAPLFGPYGLRVGATVLMYVALAHAWNLVGGYAGLLALAHPAFFGTGAIAFAVMLINGVPLLLCAVVACAISVLMALLIGFPTLRLRGHYFVVATMLVAEGIRSLVMNLDAFGFQGGVAVNIITFTGLRGLSASQYNLVFYLAMLAVATLAMGVVIFVDRSKWGLALRAFRDNRDAASALGIPAARLLLIMFVISAALTSLVGSIWAAWIGVVEANDAFGLKLTFETVVMVFLGGKGTVFGPVIGAAAVLMLEEVVGIEFAEFTLVSSGLIVILVILFLPDGLIRLLQDGPRALSWDTLKSNFQRYQVR
jgi:branched-chain amino acid transport system permease protein